MPGDLAMSYQLYDAAGYDFPIEARYHRLWLAEINPGMAFFPGYSLSLVVGPITASSLRGLSFLGVADILTPPDYAPLPSKDLSLAYRGPTPPSMPIAERCQGRSWSAAGAWSPGRTPHLPRSRAPPSTRSAP
jgi:hypothetical protein